MNMEATNGKETSRKYLDFAEMKKLLEVVREMPNERLLTRLLANGLAPRDIVRLRSKSFKYEQGIVKFMGKSGNKRIAQIDLPTLSLAKKYIEEQTPALERNDSVFGWTEKTIHDIVVENGKLAKLGKDVTPTLLRDTWVYLAVRGGKDEDYIHRQLGNTDLKFTRELIQTYRSLDEEHQPKVAIYVPVHEKRLNIIDSTLRSFSRLDWKNYTVTLLVNNSSQESVAQFRGIASKYGATVMDLGVIDTREEVEIDGKTFIAEIEEGGVVSIVRKALQKGLEAFRPSDADYYAVCGSDCQPHPNGIKGLIKYFGNKRFENVGIVGGIIFARGTMRVGEKQQVGQIPCVFYDAVKRKNAQECYEFFFKQWQNVEVVEVDGVGSGWALYSRKVAERVNWDLPRDITRFMGEDYYYCHQAAEKGFKTLCVCEILADHLEDGNPPPAPKNEGKEAPKAENTDKESPKFVFVGQFTGDFYDEEYFEKGVETGKSGYNGYYNHPLFKAIARELNTYFSPEKVLDVGAAKGFLVNEMVELGVDAHGIDISEYATENCPEQVGDRLVCGQAEHLPWEDREFSLVVSFDTMEHLNEEQYRHAIREMARVSGRNLLFSITTDDHVIDKSHISIMPIDRWIKIIDEEIGNDWYRSKNNFLNQTIMWFNPQMCLIYSRRKK
jgi:hypothetical protein